MLGVCNANSIYKESIDGSTSSQRYSRCFYTDMKTAIDCLKNFDEQLKTLHPDVAYKIRTLMS